MKNRILLLTGVFILFSHLVQAQQARLCFVNMPDSICPLLTAINRADFVDFLDSKMKAEVTNRLGGKSEMTAMSADYISLQVTPQSTWQMKVLTVNDSTKVICTVSTVCAPVCDSHVRFYTSMWKELPSASFMPSDSLTIDRFLSPDSVPSSVFRQVRDKADILFLKASLDSDKPVLTLVCTTPDYMDKESAEQLRPAVCKPLTYVWHNGKFVLEPF